MIALIVEAALRSLALGLVVGLALAIVRPRNPHLHKTVWVTVLLASLAMPFLIGLSVAPSVTAPLSVLTLHPGPTMARAPAHWLVSASALYAMVVLTLLIRFASAFLKMARIRRKATVLYEPWAGADDVRVSLTLRSPATFGSTILLPAEFSDWSEQKLATVMAHERSHVQRKDCYILWIARLYTCVFWINPLAWWMQSRLAALAETTSDDAVVAALGDRPAYAEVLLDLASPQARTRWAAVATEMASSRAQIARRIERIISGIAPSAVPKRRHRALAVALLLPAVAASATTLVPPMRLAQADPPPAGTPNDMNAPQIIYMPPLEDYYPSAAKARAIVGFVQVSVAIDADGIPTRVTVIDEHPQSMDFGTSAIALVQAFRFSNPARKPAEFPMKVRFALPGIGPGGSSPLPPPQSPAGG
jgi:TonB family protein